MSLPLLEAHRVRKVFQREGQTVEALAEIDLSIHKGEFVAITGPSGSGKSTLLYLLGALDQPTTGEIRLMGDSTSEMRDRELASVRNRQVGFVFQFHFLISELTALENVMVPALLAGRTSATSQERAHDLLVRVGLSQREQHRPAQLSGGEQQRVAIARALMNAPALLLGDEPTGNLDSATGDAIYELLREQNKEHQQTIVVVTHNPALALRADRVIHMVDGRMAANLAGPMAEAPNKPRLNINRTNT
ncbi:MAG: ABC transporter ATP-binding protein [Cyanobacteria bacterium REEB65]|nr:ABC transporter ATP-binding protein [Cyanobacteria bacterium REEB65]